MVDSVGGEGRSEAVGDSHFLLSDVPWTEGWDRKGSGSRGSVTSSALATLLVNSGILKTYLRGHGSKRVFLLCRKMPQAVGPGCVFVELAP